MGGVDVNALTNNSSISFDLGKANFCIYPTLC